MVVIKKTFVLVSVVVAITALFSNASAQIPLTEIQPAPQREPLRALPPMRVRTLPAGDPGESNFPRTKIPPATEAPPLEQPSPEPGEFPAAKELPLSARIPSGASPAREVVPVDRREDLAPAAAIAVVADKAAAAQPSAPAEAGEPKQLPTPAPRGVTGLVRGEALEIWEKVLEVWRYKIFSTKDVELSLQNIVGGLLLLWIGSMLARRISYWFGTKVLTRVGLPPATAVPLQKVSFYFLFSIFALFSLQFVGVPMTVFTFFGGALAIGIGFGSQNVMNNFISGLILLAERPIRVGDVIQIDGHSGKVSEIGARSTRITTGANLEIIIPNSTFLQGNVVNWTLSDDTISSKVVVGVAYGSPARDVARLLRQVAEEHELILKNPGPGVAFTDFSEHAMMFELSFWIRMSAADRGKVESELRFRIDDLFADHGIVIAYPQRDVHLNLLRPVEVRLTQPLSSGNTLREAAA